MPEGELERIQREMMNLMTQSQQQMTHMLTQLVQQIAKNGNQEQGNNGVHGNTMNQGNNGNQGQSSTTNKQGLQGFTIHSSPLMPAFNHTDNIPAENEQTDQEFYRQVRVNWQAL